MKLNRLEMVGIESAPLDRISTSGITCVTSFKNTFRLFIHMEIPTTYRHER